MPTIGYIVMGLLTLLSGGLSFWSRDALEYGWYSERAGVGICVMPAFILCIAFWIMLIFNIKLY